MDTALANRIVNTATALASTKTSDALNIRVLKKALDIQQNAAATMLQAVAQTAPAQQPLATSGALGTQLNTFA